MSRGIRFKITRKKSGFKTVSDISDNDRTMIAFLLANQHNVRKPNSAGIIRLDEPAETDGAFWLLIGAH